jgi:Beta-propeller repeat
MTLSYNYARRHRHRHPIRRCRRARLSTSSSTLSSTVTMSCPSICTTQSQALTETQSLQLQFHDIQFDNVSNSMTFNLSLMNQKFNQMPLIIIMLSLVIIIINSDGMIAVSASDSTWRGPSTRWSYQLGSDLDDVNAALAVDSAGNVLVCGTTYGVMKPSLPWTVTGTYASTFVTKLQVDNHTEMWRTQFGSDSFSTQARAITTDANDNILIAGYIWPFCSRARI